MFCFYKHYTRLVMAKVTIILTTYNRLEFLEQSISSILNQSYQDFELIVLDNGSTVDVKGIINKYDGVKIRYIREEVNNKYQSEFISKIFNLCNSEYFIWTFDDDFWEETLLEKEIKVMEDDKEIAVVSCNAKIVNVEGVQMDLIHPMQNDNVIFEKYGFIKNYISKRINVKCVTGAMLIRSEVLRKLDTVFFDDFESLQGDTYWQMKMNEIGKIVILKDAEYNHRVYGQGQATFNYTGIFRAVLYSIPLLKKYCDEEECNEFERKIMNMLKTAELNVSLRGDMLKIVSSDTKDIEKKYFEKLAEKKFQTNDYNRIEMLYRIKYMLNTLGKKEKQYYIIREKNDVEEISEKTRIIIDVLMMNLKFVDYIDMEKVFNNEMVFSKDNFYVIASKSRCFECAERLNASGLKPYEDYMWGLGIY